MGDTDKVQTVGEAGQVHGMNPEFLIEKILRTRIHESIYWKEHCFALTAETLIDKAVALKYVGGQYGLLRPSEFLCLTLKLLQLQPDKEILRVYLGQQDHKYLTALTAFYIRLTMRSVEVYTLLEPFLLDKRKLRMRDGQGNYFLGFMDDLVDKLLRDDRVCDIALPRLTRRSVLVEAGDLEDRVSPLEDDLMMVEEELDVEAGQVVDSSAAALGGTKRDLETVAVENGFAQGDDDDDDEEEDERQRKVPSGSSQVKNGGMDQDHVDDGVMERRDRQQMSQREFDREPTRRTSSKCDVRDSEDSSSRRRDGDYDRRRSDDRDDRDDRRRHHRDDDDDDDGDRRRMHGGDRDRRRDDRRRRYDDDRDDEDRDRRRSDRRDRSRNRSRDRGHDDRRRDRSRDDDRRRRHEEVDPRDHRKSSEPKVLKATSGPKEEEDRGDELPSNAAADANDATKKKWSSKKVGALFKKQRDVPKPVEAAAPAAPAAGKDAGKDGEAVSIEETNRMRLALGLKPLKM